MRKFGFAFTLLSALVCGLGCSQETTDKAGDAATATGEAVEVAAKDAAEGVEKAADEAGEAMEGAADAVEAEAKKLVE